VVVCVCVCCTICKATDAQFAEPQTHILQSNRSVQSTAETSCLPCSVAVALTAIGLTTIGLDACSVALQPPHHYSHRLFLPLQRNNSKQHQCHLFHLLALYFDLFTLRLDLCALYFKLFTLSFDQLQNVLALIVEEFHAVLNILEAALFDFLGDLAKPHPAGSWWC